MEYSYSDEVKNLVSIVDGRFENEPKQVQEIRLLYAEVIDRLVHFRNLAGRSESGRNASLAITHAEDSCIRAVKALYSKTE